MSSCCCLKTCGDAELNSCFVVATVFAFLWLLLLAFPWVLWVLTGCWRAQRCKEQSLEHLSLLQLPAGSSFWLLLPDGRLWVPTTCCALSEWSLCLVHVGSAGREPMFGSGWKAAVVSILALQALVYFLIIFLKYFNSLQWCLSGCQTKHCHICNIFCLFPPLCMFSLWCFGLLPRLCLPLSPLEQWKHFCCSSHSSRWFFTFLVIVAVWSLSQIL